MVLRTFNHNYTNLFHGGLDKTNGNRIHRARPASAKMASALALLNFISSPMLTPVAFHPDYGPSTRKAFSPKLIPSVGHSKYAKCHLSATKLDNKFNLADFLQGDWILHKNISYSKLYQDVSGSEGEAIFEGQASFVSVKPPRTAAEPHHLWYKEHGSVTMAGRATVRCFLLHPEFP